VLKDERKKKKKKDKLVYNNEVVFLFSFELLALRGLILWFGLEYWSMESPSLSLADLR
jgi:hypothetical protein